MAQTTDSTPMLQSNVQLDDIVDFEHTQCYRYYVTGEGTDVQVQLTTYSGKTELQATPEKIPDKWEDFKIKADMNETEFILDMRPWIRQHRGGKVTGLYYICVKGLLTSTYSMRLKEFKQSYD